MNIKNMMKQAQQMQSKMQEAQEKLKDVMVEGTAGGGMVTVTMSARNDAKAVKLDESLIDKSEIEMLEDLIVAAFNDACTKAEAAAQEEMSKVTNGMPMGDMKLPF